MGSRHGAADQQCKVSARRLAVFGPVEAVCRPHNIMDRAIVWLYCLGSVTPSFDPNALPIPFSNSTKSEAVITLLIAPSNVRARYFVTSLVLLAEPSKRFKAK